MQLLLWCHWQNTVMLPCAVHAGSYLLCSASQSAYPKNYRHEDGGVYSGQWQGRNKQGLGVYRYPGGARYEGEWRNNSKEGRGVYTFPKVKFPAALSPVQATAGATYTHHRRVVLHHYWRMLRVGMFPALYERLLRCMHLEPQWLSPPHHFYTSYTSVLKLAQSGQAMLCKGPGNAVELLFADTRVRVQLTWPLGFTGPTW